MHHDMRTHAAPRHGLAIHGTTFRMALLCGFIAGRFASLSVGTSSMGNVFDETVTREAQAIRIFP